MKSFIARAWTLALVLGSYTLFVPAASGAITDPPFCGEEGVWIQVLRAGALRYVDTSYASSYLVWIDNQAKLLVDAGHGAALRFDEADAKIEDLDAIAITHLHRENTSDLWAFMRSGSPEKRLSLMGPFDEDNSFLEEYAGIELAPKRPTVHSIGAVGRGHWGGFGNETFRAAAIPVDHGDARGLAWRITIGDQSITFTGDFSNQKNVLAEFAKESDALVANLGMPEEARGEAREAFARPSQIGRIAAEADVRMLILGGRGARTRGREVQTLDTIEKSYSGPIIIADDLECWGL